MKKEPGSNPENEKELREEENQMLWEFFKKRNNQAAAYIYSNYFNVLLSFGCRRFGDDELVKDCIQEVFLDLLSNAERLKDIKLIDPYLRKCLVYKILKKLKHKDKEVTQSQLERTNESFIDDIADESEVQEFSEQDFQHLQKVFRSLPEKQRRAITLRFFRSLRFKQIAENMDIGENYAETLVYRTIKKLKSEFDEYRSGEEWFVLVLSLESWVLSIESAVCNGQ